MVAPAAVAPVVPQFQQQFVPQAAVAPNMAFAPAAVAPAYTPAMAQMPVAMQVAPATFQAPMTMQAVPATIAAAPPCTSSEVEQLRAQLQALEAALNQRAPQTAQQPH
jgi:hypothetical protein